MTKKYILLSLGEKGAENLAKVIGNKTCKKIIDFLSETKEASEKDISDYLKLPLNTIEYNLKKLIESGFVEKSKTFFWSQKGKKIPTYKLSNKSILISPSSKVQSKILPALISIGASIIGTFAISRIFSSSMSTGLNEPVLKSQDAVYGAAAEAANEAALRTGEVLTSQPFPVWGWFLLGAIFAILIYTLMAWRKMK